MRNRKSVAAVLATCIVIVIIVRDCTSEVPIRPHAEIAWPATFSELSDRIPIEFFGWQRGFLRTSYKEIDGARGKLKAVIYYFEDRRHKCYGSVSCIVDAQGADSLLMLVDGSVPLTVQDPRTTDYSVSQALEATNSWVALKIKRLSTNREMEATGGPVVKRQ